MRIRIQFHKPLNLKTHINTLFSDSWQGSIFGVGDWFYYSGELKSLLKNGKSSGVEIFIPTGWDSLSTKNSKQFSKTYFMNFHKKPDPVVAYTFDATIIGLDSLCNNRSPDQSIKEEWVSSKLLRHYNGIGDGNNLLSPMMYKTFAK